MIASEKAPPLPLFQPSNHGHLCLLLGKLSYEHHGQARLRVCNLQHEWWISENHSQCPNGPLSVKNVYSGLRALAIFFVTFNWAATPRLSDQGGFSSTITKRQTFGLPTMMARVVDSTPVDLRIHRWQEVRINKNVPLADEGDRISAFSDGVSAICIENVATIAERRKIVEACSYAAKEYRDSRKHQSSRDAQTMVFSDSEDSGMASDEVVTTHIPINCEAGLVRLNAATGIPSIANKIMREQILPRVLRIIDRQFPFLVTSLFGDTVSLEELYSTSADGQLLPISRGRQEHESKLEFAHREPAINVYVTGGKFKPHVDGQSLTVLIPLSDDAAFTSLGTGFWCHGLDAEEVAPTICLRPPAGTAMLFGGNVKHAGMAVERGERVVLVASFSRREFL